MLRQPLSAMTVALLVAASSEVLARSGARSPVVTEIRAVEQGYLLRGAAPGAPVLARLVARAAREIGRDYRRAVVGARVASPGDLEQSRRVWQEAAALLERHKSTFSEADPAALAALEEAMGELAEAWPEKGRQAGSVMPERRFGEVLARVRGAADRLR